MTGKDISAAEQILFDMGLDYTVRTQNEENVPVDQVIKTDPPAGTQIEKNTQIVIYVSRGQTQSASKVPAVVGLDKDTAREKLEAAGLVVSITEVDSDKAPGIVVEQSLKANEYIKEGDSITLEVSNGSGYYKKVTLAVDFPPDAQSREYKLIVYINGEDKGSATVNPSQSPTWNVTVDGSGVQKVIISLDGVKYAEYEVDFDKGTFTLTQGYYDEIIDRIGSGGGSPNTPSGGEPSSEPSSTPTEGPIDAPNVE